MHVLGLEAAMRWVLGLILAFPFCAQAAAADAARPNILIVLVDDAGLGDYSCEGQPFFKSPNIDRLHDRSIRFADFHVTPMCTPTRGQLLTGLDAVRNGATSVTGGRSFIREGIPTLPQMLAAGGYRTGIFGKWHLGDNYPNRPMDRGFQTALWLKGWGFTSAPMFSNSLIDGWCWRGDKRENFKGYITDICFNEAMAWMRTQNESKQPFFCYLPLNAAHAPWEVPEKYAKPYMEKANKAAPYFGMLANIDENMGKLEKFLDESHLRDNTILIFMNDNGGTGGVRFFNAGLRGHKTEYIDGGHRSPCYITWPAGKLRPAGEIADVAQIQDLAPTLLDFAGIQLPNGYSADGANLAPLLRGRIDALPERTLVVQYSRAKLEKWECCVIRGKWRLVEGKELYDIVADRAQKNDLAKQNPEMVKSLRDYYEKWWGALGDKVNEFVPIGVGSEKQPHVSLSSSDWQDVYCDNAGHIRNAVGGPRGGPWNINVMKAGDYDITLRRWPEELNLPLSAPEPKGGKALPIAAASLTVAGQTLSAKAADPQATTITIRATLPAGRTQLHGWFQDAQGKDLCGAFYADVTPAK
jgi:arylsulfatase